MISNGNTTIYVSDIDAAIRFYTGALGLELTNRFGRQWATLQTGPSYWTTDEVGAGLVIALHPQTPRTPKPGTKGSTVLGLVVDGSIDRAMSRLAERGVRASGAIVRSSLRGHVEIADPDGNTIYLWEEAVAAYAPEAKAARAASR